VTKQIRNFSQAKLTIGLDLGDRSSWYCLLDESGCPSSLNTRLTHGECIPVSNAIRLSILFYP
jgi:hypothetical protein